MKAIIGTKIGMTSIVDDNGSMVAVTLLSADPNVITQVKTDDIDGYQALQLGHGEDKKAGKSKLGHAKKSGAKPARHVKEVRVSELPEGVKAGDTVGVDAFEPGDVVKVTGTSKGKGFAGAIKRHNFGSQRKSHGAKGNTRKLGSIGSMYPQKVYKGRKMPGQMGYERVTVSGLTVALVEPEMNVIGIKGAVPGPKKGLVMVQAHTTGGNK